MDSNVKRSNMSSACWRRMLRLSDAEGSFPKNKAENNKADFSHKLFWMLVFRLTEGKLRSCLLEAFLLTLLFSPTYEVTLQSSKLRNLTWFSLVRLWTGPPPWAWFCWTKCLLKEGHCWWLLGFSLYYCRTGVSNTNADTVVSLDDFTKNTTQTRKHPQRFLKMFLLLF